MLNDAVKVLFSALSEGIRPDDLMTVSEWAERHRVLSQSASAEPGRWRNSRTPYLVEPMDALSTSDPTQEVVIMAGAQLGKTEAINNFIGYVIDQAPGPMMSVMPTLSMAKRNTKMRLDPLIAGTPRLANKVASPRSRDSGNTVFQKDFPGGVLLLVGANSPSDLSSTPIKYLPMDEIDRFPGDLSGEGDAISIATARTKTFRRRKLIKTSTPTIQGVSRIEAAYLDSDQRKYHVPCPDCGHKQVLKWENLKWEKGKPETAEYACESCGSMIPEYKKTKMLAEGVWVPDNPGHKVKGYHLPTLYSPVGFCSWADMAREWESVMKTTGSQRLDKMKVFVNTMLGEPWAERGEAPDWEKLYHENRESYPIGSIPAGGLLLTAGADVQKDRIEVEVVAWGRNKESWSVDYLIFYGDTTQPEVWEKVDGLLQREFPHEKGSRLKIHIMAIDAGYNSQVVYNFVRKYSPDHVIAVKGRDQQPSIAAHPTIVDVKINGRRYSRGSRVWPIGVSVIKREIYADLKQRPATEDGVVPSGLCHFPEYGEEFFKQITAEQQMKRVVRGFTQYVWEKTRERNEALDCRAYNRAAAHVAGFDRFEEKDFETLENSVTISERSAPHGGKPKRKRVGSMI